MMTLVSFDPSEQILHLTALSLNDLEEQAVPVIKESSNVVNGVVGPRIVQQVEKIPLAEGLCCLACINDAQFCHDGTKIERSY